MLKYAALILWRKKASLLIFTLFSSLPFLRQGMIYGNSTQIFLEILTRRLSGKRDERPEYGQYLCGGSTPGEDWERFLPLHHLSQVVHLSTACPVHQQLSHFIRLQNCILGDLSKGCLGKYLCIIPGCPQ